MATLDIKDFLDGELHGAPAYSVSFPPRSPGLAESMKRAGQTSPITAVRSGNGYAAVCGVRRLRAAGELGWTCVRAEALSPPPDPFRCFAIGIEDNAGSRGLNVFEAAAAASAMLERFGLDRGTVVREWLARLGFPASELHLERLLRVASLPEDVKLQAFESGIDAEKLLLIADLEPGDAEPFARLAIELRPTLSVLREIRDNCADLSRRLQIPARQVLELAKGKTRLKNAGAAQVPQKAQSVREAVFRLHSPRLHDASEKAAALADRMRLPRGVSLTHHPFLEDCRATVRFSFESAEELRKIAETLAEIAGGKALRDYLDVLRGK